MAGRSHKESIEQRALLKWAQVYRIPSPPHLDTPLLADYLFAIPNGGKRSKAEAGIMKAEGVKAGVSDLFLPIARGGYYGLWIELKPADKSGRLTNAQKHWLILMAVCGYRAVCCTGWLHAKQELIDYVNEDDTWSG